MATLTDTNRLNFLYILIILFCLITLWFTSSCTSYQKCLAKYGTTENDTTFHTFYDTTKVFVDVPLPKDDVTGSIDVFALDQDSLVYESVEGRARATFWKDQFDSILFRAECLPDTIVREVQVPYEVKVPIKVTTTKFIKPPEPKAKQNSFIERIAMWIGTGVLIILLILALWHGGKKILSTYFPAFKIINLFKWK